MKAPTRASGWLVEPRGQRASDAVPAPVIAEPSIERGPVGAPTGTTRWLPTVATAPPGDGSLVWVGAHGGSGVTSIVRATGIGLDLSKYWPDPANGWPVAAVLTFRTSATGILAAGRAMADCLSGDVSGVDLVALLAIADIPGRVPKPLRRRLSELGSAGIPMFQLEWIAQWRDGPPAATSHLTKTAAAIAALISKEKS